MHRILTYNVHRCLGTDNKFDLARVAEVIRACAAEIVALQELDAGRSRSGGVDQAERLAHALGMHFCFHPALRDDKELYGDAILTRHPLKEIKAGLLPAPLSRRAREPRGAIWVTTLCGGRMLDVVTTHLGLRGLERLHQTRALLGPEWLADRPRRHPTILLGDFNAVPNSRAYRALTRVFRDAQIVQRRPRPTFPSRFPVLRLDHVFVSPAIDVLHTDTVRTPLARRASDHLPLLMDFAIRAGEQGSR